MKFDPDKHPCPKCGFVKLKGFRKTTSVKGLKYWRSLSGKLTEIKGCRVFKCWRCTFAWREVA
jgi:hypothetical protein